jgi:hypothetical protein
MPRAGRSQFVDGANEAEREYEEEGSRWDNTMERREESGEGLGWQEGDYPMDTGKSEATSCFI